MYIPANIAVEDLLSEIVLRKIIALNNRFCIGTCYSKGGYGYLRKTIKGFNNAAKGSTFIVLSDLEDECAPLLISNWLQVSKHPNLIFRIAVHEVEAWLLADLEGIASYLGISQSLIPSDVDNINDPKKCLIELAKRSPYRKIREAIVPSPHTTATVGPNYNGQLANFVNDVWNIESACNKSDSLKRAVKEIVNFKPI